MTDQNATLDGLSGMSDPYQQQLQEDTSALEDINHDAAAIPAFDAAKEEQGAPQINRNGVMSTAPFLLGLTALGGKLAGVHAKTMLSATNGMMGGLIKGNQQAYQDSRQKYEDAYQRYIDKHRQQLQIFNEMRQVYKGRIDADLRALEIARKATGDQTKIDQNGLHGWQWEQNYARQLEETHEKERHNLAAERNTASGVSERGRHDIATENKTSSGGTPAQRQKAKDLDVKVTRAKQLIKELKELLGKKGSVAGIPVDRTGAITGRAARISETVGNKIGLSDDTGSRDFESKLSELKILTAELKLHGRSAKDQRDLVSTMVRGTNFGDSPQNTISALDSLDESLSQSAPSDPSDPFEVGKDYKNKQGQQATYLGNGKWKLKK